MFNNGELKLKLGLSLDQPYFERKVVLKVAEIVWFRLHTSNANNK